MGLFIILTLEEEKGIFRQDSSDVVMCCMEMVALLCSCGSCCNFCFNDGDGRVCWNRCEDSLHVIGCKALIFLQPDGCNVFFKVLGVPDVMRGVSYQWPEDGMLANSFATLYVCDCTPAGCHEPKAVPCLCI